MNQTKSSSVLNTVVTWNETKAKYEANTVAVHQSRSNWLCWMVVHVYQVTDKKKWWPDKLTSFLPFLLCIFPEVLIPCGIMLPLTGQSLYYNRHQVNMRLTIVSIDIVVCSAVLIIMNTPYTIRAGRRQCKGKCVGSLTLKKGWRCWNSAMCVRIARVRGSCLYLSATLYFIPSFSISAITQSVM